MLIKKPSDIKPSEITPESVYRNRRQFIRDSGTLALGWLTFFRKTQKMLERQHRKQRRELLKHEKQRNDTYKRMGLDPCLELTES